MRRTVFLAIAAALAACGQPKPADTNAPTVAAAPAPAPAPATATLSPDVIATRIAALPAPYNQGDYAKGKVVFGQCRSCHTIEAGGSNRVGPHLHGVFGRRAGAVDDFKTYSKGLKDSAIVWDAEQMDKWVTNPREVVPVNNMIFPGLRKEEDRHNLIAYIAAEAAD
ncbi:MAG: cytochrome c family protein [Alphaproteobacteria bacterium]|nr:cytochrome c family protein [Alphaproteobacteria bacterium]